MQYSIQFLNPKSASMKLMPKEKIDMLTNKGVGDCILSFLLIKLVNGF